MILISVVLVLSHLVFAEDIKTDIYLYVGSPAALSFSNVVKIDTNQGVVPYIKNARTMVPIRFLTESIGFTISFDNVTRTAVLEKNGRLIKVSEGDNFITVNNKNIEIEAAAEIKNSRMFVPLRAIAEATGLNVDYKKGLIAVNSSIISINDTDYNRISNEISPIKRIESEEQAKALLANYRYYPEGENIDDSMSLIPVPDENRVSSTTAKEGGGSGGIASSAPITGEISMSDEALADSYSETNTQIKGVDEADIIKTDGEYIYVISNNMIKIIDADPLKVISEITLPTPNINVTELFIHNKKLITLSTYHENVLGNTNGVTASKGGVGGYRSIYMNNMFTDVSVFDLTDPTAPVLDRQVSIEGNYITSRKIGQYLYFVSNTYKYNNVDIMPVIKENAKVIDKPITALCYIPNFKDNSVTTIASIDIENKDKELVTESLLGSSRNIFCSLNNLYIATDVYEERQMTEIYRFQLANGDVFASGKGKVSGSILNQFSMDEYDSHLRIATNLWDNTSKNQLYVLDESMNISGSILNIAPGERIYSVRFLGSKGYMVTFRQTDPFFAIDLSDHENPKIMGILKIPGFSEYLHPYDEKTIIGFGRDADANGRIRGYKISVFDVTNFTEPVEVCTEIIGGVGTYSELSTNHRALLENKDTGLFAFPISIADDNSKNNGEQGMIIYNFKKDTGFVKQGLISHNDTKDYPRYENSVKRGIYIGNTIYTFSDSKIVASDLDNLNTLSETGLFK